MPEDGESYTVPEVVKEARGLTASALIGVSLTRHSLRVWDASAANVDRVEEELRKLGGRLSQTDVRVIALALDLSSGGQDPTILTDDYGIQNLARVLNLRYSPIMTKGIRSVFEWKKACSGCGKECAGEGDICPVCGSKLVRVAVRRPC